MSLEQVKSLIKVFRTPLFLNLKRITKMELEITGTIIVGILVGLIANTMMKGKGFELVMNLLVGAIGAVVGGYIFNILGLHWEGFVGTLIVSVLGAVALLWVLSLFRGYRHNGKSGGQSNS